VHILASESCDCATCRRYTQLQECKSGENVGTIPPWPSYTAKKVLEVVSEGGSSSSSATACASSIAVGRRSEDQEDTGKEIAFSRERSGKRVVIHGKEVILT
jgi:hypothetical protein